MQMTFRWYGNEFEKISLSKIKQIPGVTGVVGCLMDIPVGEVWPEKRISALVKQVHDAGLTIEVIESVNIHDDIKIGLPSRDRYIENYKQTIRNLAKYGIKVICYNFMPIFDWIKSDLNYVLPDGSKTLAFEKNKIPDDPKELLARYSKHTGGFTLPGWEPSRLAHLEYLFNIYKDVDENKLRQNLLYFLNAIMPTCEKYNIRMAIHPDDPPYSLFGLPRIIKNRNDLDWLCRTVDTPYNGITLCTGSIAEDPTNDVYAILEEFTRRGRIYFAHVRNICYLHPEIPGNKDFYEAPHLSSDGSLDMYRIVKALYDNGFKGYIRPDHGRMIWGEVGRPGYGLYDRALGIAYINGLWEALDKCEKGV
jgi:mannonate dehydratase